MSMKIGVVTGLNTDMREKLRAIRAMDMDVCQVTSWHIPSHTESNALALKAALNAEGVACTTFWCGYSGRVVWDFVEGPITLGVVPDALREARRIELLGGVEFAHTAGINKVATHAGFIPEDLNDPKYAPTVEALRSVAARAKALDMEFLFETGQETPTTLLRVIEDIGLDNVGINLDPANLIMYGKGNPVDALSVIGRYIKDVHAKDGEYPTTGRALGVEKRLGDGCVNFPALIERLKAVGYSGALIIEREISGEQQARDIAYARDLLRGLV